MIERILEPEYMDTPEDAADYDSMDHSGVNRIFASDFLAVWNRRSPIIDIGTGTAQIPIEFCRQSSEGTIIALDAAEQMLILARHNIKLAGFTDRISCQLVDAKGMPFGDGSISAIMSNSIIHHIPEPRKVFQEIRRLATPGATIFLRDLLRPNSVAEIQHLVATYAGRANTHQQQLFRESLHAALTVSEVQDLVKEIGFDPASVKQTTDRHWTWSVPGVRS